MDCARSRCPALERSNRHLDDASWRVARKVKRWPRHHNLDAELTGYLRLGVWASPKRSPWLMWCIRQRPHFALYYVSPCTFEQLARP